VRSDGAIVIFRTDHSAGEGNCAIVGRIGPKPKFIVGFGVNRPWTAYFIVDRLVKGRTLDTLKVSDDYTFNGLDNRIGGKGRMNTV
jgi:hypothetical protein